MVNDLIDSISECIKSVITKEAIIRADNTEQVMEPKPFFFIKLLNSIEREKLGVSMVRHNFVVSFFPEDVNAENTALLNQGAEALLFALKKIPMKNGYIKRGLNRHSKISEGVLHVFFSIDLMLWEIKERSQVRTLESERMIKNG